VEGASNLESGSIGVLPVERVLGAGRRARGKSRVLPVGATGSVGVQARRLVRRPKKPRAGQSLGPHRIRGGPHGQSGDGHAGARGTNRVIPRGWRALVVIQRLRGRCCSKARTSVRREGQGLKGGSKGASPEARECRFRRVLVTIKSVAEIGARCLASFGRQRFGAAGTGEGSSSTAAQTVTGGRL
jgi:hypothetical protein